jgi:ankyrin repeat protein
MEEPDDAIFLLLLAAGAVPDKPCGAGVTPLHDVSRSGRIKLVRKLLLVGVDPEGECLLVKVYTPARSPLSVS